MLQAEQTITSNHLRGSANTHSRADYWIKLGKNLDNNSKLDILEFLLDTKIPDEFEWKADLKYLYYKNGKIVGMMIYKIVPMVGKPTPLCVHIVGSEKFRRSIKGYKFMIETFKDLHKEYPILVTHIPNERTYIINEMLRFGFAEYSQDDYGKYYYLYLDKIRS